MICGNYWMADSGISGSFKNGYRQGMVDGIKVFEFNISYSNSDSFLSRTFSFIRYSLRGILMALKEDFDIVL